MHSSMCIAISHKKLVSKYDIYQKNSNRFSCRVNYVSCLGFLALITVPSMCSVFWNGVQIQP